MGGAEKSGHLLIQDNETYIQYIESLKLDESEYKQRQFKNERNLKNYTIKLKLQQKEVL